MGYWGIMCGNEWLDSSANLFMEMPWHNEDAADALVEILFLITAIPYGFPKVRVYPMKIPLKHFFSRKEAAVIQWEGASLVLHPLPGVGDALPLCVIQKSSESLPFPWQEVAKRLTWVHSQLYGSKMQGEKSNLWKYSGSWPGQCQTHHSQSTWEAENALDQLLAVP